jgi:hypothetical protein
MPHKRNSCKLYAGKKSQVRPLPLDRFCWRGGEDRLSERFIGGVP